MLTIYCNSVTRQRLSRNLTTIIEYEVEELELHGIQPQAWKLLRIVAQGSGRLNINLENRERLGCWLTTHSKRDPVILNLACQLQSPFDLKLWSMSPDNFDRWARKSSVLVVQSGV